MSQTTASGSPGSKGKIGVLIEEHFDQTEYEKFNAYFPTQGYEVEYITHLWGNPSLTFTANPDDGVIRQRATVTTEINDVDPADYKAIILIGAYAMDRLRYQEKITPGQPNQAPALQFIRRALQTEGLWIGTLCHSLWLLCADRNLISGRKVTCAHNIVCDVENAGGEVVYEGDQTAELVIDGNLISAKHTAIVDRLMRALVEHVERPPAQA